MWGSLSFGVLLHMVGSSVSIQCYDCNKKDRFREMVRASPCNCIYVCWCNVDSDGDGGNLGPRVLVHLIILITSHALTGHDHHDHPHHDPHDQEHPDQPCPGPLVEYPTSRACRVVALSTGEVVQQVDINTIIRLLNKHRMNNKTVLKNSSKYPF